MSARRVMMATLLAVLPCAALAQSGSGSSGSGSGSGPGGGGGSGRIGGLTPEAREAIRQERQERQDRRNSAAGGEPNGARAGGESLADGQRPLLEQRVRERFAMVVRSQLRLDDKQMRQLGDASHKFEGRRRDLNARERSARDVLRTEVAADKNADNPRVATALQEILSIQKERSAILEDEDKELSNFLSPVQRARWFALQDQLRRRVEEMRRRAAAGLDPAGGAGTEPPEG